MAQLAESCAIFFLYVYLYCINIHEIFHYLTDGNFYLNFYVVLFG